MKGKFLFFQKYAEAHKIISGGFSIYNVEISKRNATSLSFVFEKTPELVEFVTKHGLTKQKKESRNNDQNTERRKDSDS